MEIVYFTVVAIVLYLAANSILERVERSMGRRLEYRTVAFFLILLVGGKRIGDPWAGWLATAMVAGSFPLLVALRTLQALFASALMPSVQSMLRTLVPARERGDIRLVEKRGGRSGVYKATR